MLRWMTLVCAVGLICLNLAASVRAADAPAATDPAPKQALQELTTKLGTDAKPSGGDSTYACPVNPGAANGGGAGNGVDISQLKAMAAKWRVSTKNLPPGNYHERCYACMTKPNNDGERELSCVCPGKVYEERMSVTLDGCREGTEVSYCAGVLVCGKCMFSEDTSTAPAAKSAEDQNTTRLMSEMLLKPTAPPNAPSPSLDSIPAVAPVSTPDTPLMSTPVPPTPAK